MPILGRSYVRSPIIVRPQEAVAGVTIAPATETDTAVALSITKTIFKTLTPATTTDAAQALSVTKPIVKTLTAATTTDTAQALSITKTIFKTLGPAVETDTAVALTIAGVAAVARTRTLLGVGL